MIFDQSLFFFFNPYNFFFFLWPNFARNENYKRKIPRMKINQNKNGPRVNRLKFKSQNTNPRLYTIKTNGKVPDKKEPKL